MKRGSNRWRESVSTTVGLRPYQGAVPQKRASLRDSASSGLAADLANGRERARAREREREREKFY